MIAQNISIKKKEEDDLNCFNEFYEIACRRKTKKEFKQLYVFLWLPYKSKSIILVKSIVN